MNSIDTAQNYFDLVPTEIVCAIFSHLDPISIGRMQRVATRFQHIAQEKIFTSMIQKYRSFRQAILNRELKCIDRKTVDAALVTSMCNFGGDIFSAGMGERIPQLAFTLDKELVTIGLLEGHKASISKLSCSTNRLFSFSLDNTVKIWERGQKKSELTCTQTIKESSSQISNIACSDNRLFIGFFSGLIDVWKFNVEKKAFEWIQNLDEHEPSVIRSLSYAEGKLVSGSADRTIKVWKLASDGVKCEMSQMLIKHSGILTCLCLSGEKLISGSTDTTIRVWRRREDHEGFEPIQKLTQHCGSVTSLFCKDGMLFSSSEDQSINIYLWSAKGMQYRYIQSLDTKIDLYCVLCTESLLLAGGEGGEIQVWSY